MENHPIEGILDETMKKIKEMVDVNTIVGAPITSPDGSTIIPVSKVTCGFASGGSDLPTKKLEAKELFAGGSSAGITITPVAFLAVTQGDVKLLQVEPFNSATDRVIGMIPEVIDKISCAFKKNKKKNACKTDSCCDTSHTHEGVSSCSTDCGEER